VIGYFIPGVRHFTGFSSGMATLPFHHFALFAYSGALLWVTSFLTIGYFFGHKCFELCRGWF
jgi:membrane protein DedA with SNARE-associated domain